MTPGPRLLEAPRPQKRGSEKMTSDELMANLQALFPGSFPSDEALAAWAEFARTAFAEDIEAAVDRGGDPAALDPKAEG
jgi:hypothetical protein